MLAAWSYHSGILLHGPPGVGKTIAVESLCAWLRVEDPTTSSVTLRMPELFQKNYGDGERMLVSLVDRAIAGSSRTLVVLDEIDVLGGGGGGPNQKMALEGEGEEDVNPSSIKMLRLVLALLDELHSRGSVMVIGVTNAHDGMDKKVVELLTREGRLPNVIECGVPNVEERRDVLELMTSRMVLSGSGGGGSGGGGNGGGGGNDDDDDDDGSGGGLVLDYLATRTHGMVGTDLADLCREAAMHALSRDEGGGEKKAGGCSLLVSDNDWSRALLVARPSGLRATVHDTTTPPGTPTLIDLEASMIHPIQRIRTSTLRALSSPEIWTKKGIAPPSGLLLHGPSGNGKTLLACAVAKEVQTCGLGNVLIVRCTDVVSAVLGDSERALSEAFRRARRMSPCVVVLDQIEAIGRCRGSEDDTDERTWDRLLSCLLIELDGMRSENVQSRGEQPSGGSGGVYVIGTTTRLSSLDSALVRPGRFDDCLHVGPPDKDERRVLVERFVSTAVQNSAGESDVLLESSLDAIALASAGLSRANVIGVCREAIMNAIRENDVATKLETRHVLELLQ